MNNRTRRTTRRACATWIAAAAATAAIASTTTFTHAAVVSWNQPLGGNWSGLNWTGGVGMNGPTSTDHAAFTLAATYAVNLSVNPNVSGVSVGGGSNVTFTGSSFGNIFSNSGGINVSSGSFSLTGAVPVNWTNTNTIFFNANATVSNGNDLTAPGMAVGNSGLATAVFTGTGTTLTTTFVGVGIGNGGTGMLTLANGASASATATVNLATTATGNATLNVISGATFSTQGLALANSAVAGKTAYADVSGTGSTLTNNGTINIGAASASSATMAISAGGAVAASGGALTVESTGLLDVQAGGSFTIVNQPVTIGSGGGTQGKIVVGGSGSGFFQTGNVAITVGGASGSTATLQTSGSAIVSTGTGGMTINPAGLVDVAGGTFTLNGNVTINGGTLQRGAGGAFDWASSRTMTVQNGGDFLVSGFYNLPVGAAVTVTGAGSSLVQSASGNLTIGGGSTLTIAAGATVTSLGEHIADGGAGGGTVNQTGGTHTVGGGVNPMVIGVAAGATGTYNLAGGTLTVTNNLAGAAEAIGVNGAGNFVQTGGEHTVDGVNGNLVIGYGTTGVGTYSIANGNLICGSLDVGRDAGAQGTLTVNGGGMVLVAGEFLEIGLNAGATGTVNVNPGGLLDAAGIYIGGTSTQLRGTGVVNLAGGSMMTAGETRVWNTPGSALNFSAGTLATASLNTSGNPARLLWTGGTLYINGDAGLDISAAAGPLGPALAIDADQDLIVAHTTHVAAGASLACADGSTFITGSLSGAGAFSVQGNFAIVGNDNTSTTFTGTITGTGGIGKSGTGTLTVRNSRIDNLSINAGAIAVMPSGGAASGTSTVNFLNFGPDAQLDLGDNKLVVHFGDVGTFNGTSYSGLTGRIASAYNFAAWDGTGIKTSMPDAQADRGTTTIAIATADEVFYAGGTFGGVGVISGDVLLMYTYAGDLNMDGLVDGADYGLIDNFVQFPGTSGYINGDMNYDGVIDGADYGLIDNSIQLQGAPFPSGTYAGVASSSLASVTAVPEPSACVVATLATLAAVLVRRHRRLAQDASPNHSEI